MNIRKLIGRTFSYIIALLVFIVVLFPLLSVVMAAFKTNSEIMVAPEKLFPQNPTFENFVLAWKSESFKAGRMFFNSVWFSAASVAATVLVSAVSGYVFARGEFRGKKLIFVIFSALMFISMGTITIYPTLELLSFLGLSDSLFGLLIMQCFGIPIVNMYLVRGFVNALPKEIDEAAEIDGCSFTGIFFKIIFPLLKPVIITIALLSFNASWNNYLLPSIFTMNRPDQQTLMVGIMALKSSGEAASAWNLMFAATVIALVPVLVVFAFSNKYITKGIAAGAVKG